MAYGSSVLESLWSLLKAKVPVSLPMKLFYSEELEGIFKEKETKFSELSGP